MAEEKGSFYSTYSYYNEGLKEAIEIELAMRNAPNHGKGDFALARQAGFYFEAKLYDFLYKKYN